MKWVKVSDRLPNEAGHYFAKTQEGRNYIMIITDSGKLYTNHNTPFEWLDGTPIVKQRLLK